MHEIIVVIFWCIIAGVIFQWLDKSELRMIAFTGTFPIAAVFLLNSLGAETTVIWICTIITAVPCAIIAITAWSKFREYHRVAKNLPEWISLRNDGRQDEANAFAQRTGMGHRLEMWLSQDRPPPTPHATDKWDHTWYLKRN
jgi:hypothetical protein